VSTFGGLEEGGSTIPKAENDSAASGGGPGTGYVEKMICPHCGLEQPKAQSCSKCWVVVDKYRSLYLSPSAEGASPSSPFPPPAPAPSREETSRSAHGRLTAYPGMSPAGLLIQNWKLLLFLSAVPLAVLCFHFFFAADRSFASETAAVPEGGGESGVPAPPPGPEDEAVLLLTRKLKTKNVPLRLKAIRELGTSGNPLAVPPLLEVLEKAQEEEVICAAAEALARLKDRRAVPSLIAVLDDPSPRVRRAVLVALAAIEDPEAATALVRGTKDDDFYVRQTADLLLAKLSPPQSRWIAEALVSDLRNGDRFARAHAVQTLRHLSVSESVPVLVTALSDDDPTVREEATWTLVGIGKPAVPRLTEALSHRDPKVRRAAAFILGRIGDRAAVDPLLERVRDRDMVVARTAERSLGVLGDARAVPFLVAKLGESPDPPEETVESLVRMGERAREAVEEMLGSSSEWARRNAAYTLEKMKNPLSAPRLLRAVGDPSPGVRASVLRALYAVGYKRLVPVLVAALSDGDPSVRRAACELLGKSGLNAAVEPLCTVTERDGDFETRLVAVSSLGKLKDAAAVPFLSKLLGSSNRRIRKAAAAALGEIGDVSAVEPLFKYAAGLHRGLEPFEERPEYVNALQAVASLGPLAAEVVRPHLFQPDFKERWTAARALAEIGGEAARAALEERVKNGSLDVVAAAYEFFLEEEVEGADELLVKVLDRYGTAKMAERFLNSYRERLRAAGDRWACRHGYKVMDIIESK